MVTELLASSGCALLYAALGVSWFLVLTRHDVEVRSTPWRVWSVLLAAPGLLIGAWIIKAEAAFPPEQGNTVKLEIWGSYINYSIRRISDGGMSLLLCGAVGFLFPWWELISPKVDPAKRLAAVQAAISAMPTPKRPSGQAAPSRDAVLLWTSWPSNRDEWLVQALTSLAVSGVTILGVGLLVLPSVFPIWEASTLEKVLLSPWVLAGAVFSILDTRFYLPSLTQRVWIDEDSRIVYFDNVFIRRRWRLPRWSRRVAFPLAEQFIIDYSPKRTRRTNRNRLFIHTQYASLTLSSYGPHLEGLAGRLRPYSMMILDEAVAPSAQPPSSAPRAAGRPPFTHHSSPMP